MRVNSEAVATSWHGVSGSDLIGEELLGADQGGRGQGWVSDIGLLWPQVDMVAARVWTSQRGLTSAPWRFDGRTLV